MSEILAGFCQCGCGRRTGLAPQGSTKRGWVKGQPVRFIKGHGGRGRSRETIQPTRAGYVRFDAKGHPRANHRGYVFQHIVLAERALGRPLPPEAVVHHANGDPSDNHPGNLVLCQDHPYHMLLHQRMRALAACGHAGWRKCVICKRYGDVQGDNMYVGPHGKVVHRRCSAVEQSKRARRQREAARLSLHGRPAA